MMRKLLSVPFLLAAAATAQDLAWPGFRGPGRDGVAPAGDPPVAWSDTENVSWKLALPGPGSSSPIVVGERVIVACYSGFGSYLDDGGDRGKLRCHLVCVSRADGEIVWERTIDCPLASEPPRVQTSEHGFASPTPITDGETIWAYFGPAGVVAVAADDGAIRWQSDVGKPTAGAPAATNSVERGGKTLTLRWGAAASPLLHDGMVIVNASEESNSIRAFDQDTGKLLWTRESANLEGCSVSPMLAGDEGEEVVVMVLGGEVWGLAPKTGEPLWTVTTGTRGGMAPTPVADERCVYAFGGEGKSFALRLGALAAKDTDEDGAEPDARVLWQGENLDIPSPVLHGGKLFLVRTSGTGACIDASDGSTIFDGRLEGRTGSVYASPVLAGERLYVVSRKRGTFVYSADGKFELLAHNELAADDSQFNASPAVAGDVLYLRSDKYLYCLTKS
jgi:hypothetical protein